LINNSIHIQELKSEILDRNLITITTDVSGIIIDVSKGFEALFGYAKDELIGFTHQIINHPDTPSEIFAHLWSTITKGNSWCGEIKNQNKSGVAYWSKICIEPLKKENAILGFMAEFIPISLNKKNSCAKP
jgi:PAS domain S-box-containing protein